MNNPEDAAVAAPPIVADPKKAGLPLWACALAIVALGSIAYSDSFQGPFLFDDLEFIDPSAGRRPWPPLHAVGLLPSRPLIGLSFALNYAISGFSVWSYHALNLVVHLLAALALFGVVRRILLSPRLRERFERSSTMLALAVALVWVVHPVTTQSVTYMIQRCESMMGLFYLTTLYCAVRGMAAERRAGRWYVASILTCAAGMLSKEVMVTAPMMVLLCDWLFHPASLRESLRRRRGLYLGLASTWVVLAVAGILAPVNKTAGFGTKGMTPWLYFKSEFAVIVHYLRISVWPDNLVLDYAWPPATSLAQTVPYAIVVGALVVATAAALIKRKPIGFFGAWFFGILSLTSTVMPFADLAFEHRMYLPLAGVAGFAVLGAYALAERVFTERRDVARKAGLALLTVSVGLLTVTTLRRNLDYLSDLVMWTDVVSKRPENGRAHANLGVSLAQRQRLEEALAHFYVSLKYRPYVAQNQHNTGLALFELGRPREAGPFLVEALRLDPKLTVGHYDLGRVLASLGELDVASFHFSEALNIDPRHADSLLEMGRVREKQHRDQEALDWYASALRLRPDWSEALARQAVVLATAQEPGLRDAAEALRLAERAVSLTGGNSGVELDALASVYAETGDFAKAIESARTAVALASDSGDTKLSEEIRGRLRRYEEQNAVKPQASKRSR